MAHNLLGLICFILASIFAFVEMIHNNFEMGAVMITLGMSAMCIFWIMGIQKDLYGEKEGIKEC